MKKFKIPKINLPNFIVKFGSTLILSLGNTWFIVFLSSIIFLLLFWLVFSNVWLPIQEPVPLPLGVTGDNPSIETEKIKSINNQMVNRVSSKRIDFSPANQVFVSELGSETVF